MSALIQRYLDSIAASMALLNGQLEALRHAVQTESAPAIKAARIAVPTRCDGIAERACALQDDAARTSRGNFGNPTAWRCAGCGFEGDMSAM